jgi:hypothetical protein
MYIRGTTKRARSSRVTGEMSSGGLISVSLLAMQRLKRGRCTSGRVTCTDHLYRHPLSHFDPAVQYLPCST